MVSGRGVSEEVQTIESSAAPQWPAALGAASRDSKDEGAIEVALLWGDRLLDLKQFPRGHWPTVGHLPQDSIHVFAKSIGTSFPLLREVDGERILSVPVGARVALFGERTLDDAALVAGGFLRESGERPGREVALRPGERALISVGALQIAVRMVPEATRAKVSARDLDFSFFKLSAVVGLVAAAVVTVMLLPGTSETLMDDSIFHTRPPVLTKVIPRTPPPPKPKPITVGEASPSAPMEHSPRPATSQPRKPKQAGDVGLLFAFKQLGGGGVFDSGPGLGHELDTALNQLGRGVASVDGFGGPKGGPRQGGGGGGPGPGVAMGIGDGMAGVTCDADCRARQFGQFGRSHMRAHIDAGAGGKTTVVGGLDRDVIAKVIKDHQTEIKACYERALNQHPDLEGKIAVSFTIDGTGHVAQSFVAETSLEDQGVEQCILSRIGRWRFPEPRGGGEVAVNYPWIFRRAGD